ncbi:MAG TPA: L-serine ammonia-lyase, iron-sulfur-dependent, subunit beta [Firmicutes bacterium]|nr:L-serine ammonia-lyase, iron-sulfur-dependent, subunit beta [Bacillota bacterium]
MTVFDIIGPVMIGPSSSHTAGATRLGNLACAILGERPQKARIGLHGSFRDTGQGHGTDKAVVAGLLGFKPDDERIPNSFDLKGDLEVEFFDPELDGSTHPNTVVFVLTGTKETITIKGSSIGGGRVIVDKIDNFPVELSGDYPALLTVHKDRPGIIQSVSEILARYQVNIAFMKVYRLSKGKEALMLIETDQQVPATAQKEILAKKDINWVRFVDKISL